MPTASPHHHPRTIAALSGLAAAARGGAGVAVLSATLPLTDAVDAQGLGEIQLLPFGEFKARDGRPGPEKTWKLDDATGRAVAQSLSAIAAQTPVVIDYDHQTLYVAQHGGKAPAAGWLLSAEWRPGKGLWGKVDWTAVALAHIKAKEYRYISPVIDSDAQGNVTAVLLGALVNYPALLGMEAAVAALASFFSAQQETPAMNREALCALLGLNKDATDAQINTAVAALAGELPTLRTALATANARPLLTTALAGALGVAHTADEAAALSAVAALRNTTAGTDEATRTAIAALQGQVVALQGQLQGEVATLVEQAITERRALPALRDFLTGMGKKNVADLRAFIAASPVIEGLSGQSGGQERGGDAATQHTTALAAQVAANFGLTPEQFAAGAPKKAA